MAHAGHLLIIAPHHLQRQFTVDAPHKAWLPTLHMRRHENWLSLAVVIDLFSRQVVDWSMGGRIDTTLVLAALVMALWRRRPKEAVTLNSDQGSQFTGHHWHDFPREHKLGSSMFRRGTVTTTPW